MQNFFEWLQNLSEDSTRYSVEVNFRTSTDEALNHVAKVTLGYVSAALKKSDFHVKQVFEDRTLRIMVSSRNWDDGEWVGLVSWNPNKKCYIVSTGFYNKNRNSVSVPKGHEKDCSANSASGITKEIKNVMHHLKDKPDRHIQKLKKVPLKRGPK